LTEPERQAAGNTARGGTQTWPDMSAVGSSGGGVTPTSVVSATSGIDKMAQSIPAGAQAEKESCASGDADTVERTRAREGK
jgi:hypothetical protein